MIPIYVINHPHYLRCFLNFPPPHHHNFQVLHHPSPPRYPNLLKSLLLQHPTLPQYLHLIQYPLHFLLFEFIFFLTNSLIKIIISKVLRLTPPPQLMLKNPQCLILHHLLTTN